MTEPEKDDYQYGERSVPNMSKRAFKVGDGRISGYLSIGLGALSLLGVLCFRYPRWLTTGELREVYNVALLRALLQATLWSSVAFGAFALVRHKRKQVGMLGLALVLAAFLLGGAHVPTGSVQPTMLSLGLDWFALDLFVSALIFITIEKAFPRYPDQVILRPEWRLDLTYFTINHLLVGVLLLVGNGFAPMVFGWATNAHLQHFVTSLPITVQVILLIVCADFVQYWVHRAYHEVSWLWKIHAVHHSAEHMDWLAGSRNHILETLIDRSIVMIPLYLLGPDRGALDAYVAFAAIQAVFVHANVGLRFGIFKYVVVTPQYHHWHHSSDKPAIDTNYAVHLPFFDWLFRTMHLPKEHWPREYGTVTRLPRTLFAQLRYPFTPGAK